MASAAERERKKRLARRLTAIFILAFVMGPGPGIYLINPSPGRDVPRVVFGIPVLYVWAVFWFFVMAATVFTAYKKVWTVEDSE